MVGGNLLLNFRFLIWLGWQKQTMLWPPQLLPYWTLGTNFRFWLPLVMMLTPVSLLLYRPPGDRSMSSSLSASQLHTVNMRDPLNRVLGENCLLGLMTITSYLVLLCCLFWPGTTLRQWPPKTPEHHVQLFDCKGGEMAVRILQKHVFRS